MAGRVSSSAKTSMPMMGMVAMQSGMPQAVEIGDRDGASYDASRDLLPAPTLHTSSPVSMCCHGDQSRERGHGDDVQIIQDTESKCVGPDACVSC